jgi:uncharacterized membrane protein
MTERANELRYGPLVSSGLLLGTGLGGFVDGIVLHQILQWHNMLSSKLPPTNLIDMKVNMVWDGLFHALTWVATVVGVTLLFRAGRRADVPWSARALVGGMSAGWGLFNFVEGIIDHQILGIHHVHPGHRELAWDLAFLASGLVLMGIGFLLIRLDQHVPEPPRPGVLRPQRA